MKSSCLLAFGIVPSLVASCDGFVLTGSQPRTSFRSSALHQGREVLEEEYPNETIFNCDRRRVLGTCLAPLVLLPFGASASDTVVTAVEPDFDCLLDLPPLTKDCVRVYLCRHGQTENNRLRKVQGARVDPPINDNGLLQATNLGKALARADAARPQVFFSSNLQRAKMTAGTAAAQIDTLILPQQLGSLGEVDFGPVAEGQTVAVASAGMQATYAAWALGSIDYRPSGGGDSGRDVSRGRNKSSSH
jgi:hypothetical protein